VLAERLGLYTNFGVVRHLG